MTQSFLVDYAKKNIWCAPEQDKQIIYKPVRISHPSGVVNYGHFMGRRFNMPSSSKTYHVFSIGQVHPGVLSLKSYDPEFISEHWVSFKDAINATSTMVNIYTGAGKEIPKFTSYYMYTHEKCLLVCIEESPSFFIDFQTVDIYLRFYNNIEYDTDLPVGSERLFCSGKKITTSVEILSLQVEYITYLSKPGHVFCYRNGFLVDGIDAYVGQIGDVVEYIYDPTVKKKVLFTLANLSVFESELDDEYKYLLHHALGQEQSQIDFEDDIDVHILNYKNANRFDGYYFHRNNDKSHRMVTHRDYSVSVNHFLHIANSLLADLEQSPSQLESLKIQLIVRSAGDRRPLCLEHQRLFELYRLDDASIYRGMIGLDATVGSWKAEKLENSAYCRLMAVQEKNITAELVQQALGYNACSVLLGSTPTITRFENSRQVSDVPYALVENSTVYEYDQDGLLLGYYYNNNSTNYECFNSTARLTEIYYGEGSNSPGTVAGENLLEIPNCEFRVYKCTKIANVPNNLWTDVTNLPLWENNNGVLNWTSVVDAQWLLVRRIDRFLTYSFTAVATNGVIVFTLMETISVNGVLQSVPVTVPYGDMDIFINGKSLIKGLDYFVDYPKVYIVSKEHLRYPSESAIQDITVRMHGFCNSDLSMDAVEDYGFIEHGVLSNNSIYDIREDKVLRITVDGKTKHRSSLTFSEFHVGVDASNVLNGKPYQIKDIVVPMKDLVNEDTYSFRKKSQIVDKSISDYMSLKKPQPSRLGYSSIQQRYRLYSPFLSRILHDMKTGIVLDTEILSISADTQVLEFCKPYEWLLKIDPMACSPKMNEAYVLIQPHIRDTAISLNKFQYSLFLKIVRLYGNGLINITPLISLTS